MLGLVFLVFFAVAKLSCEHATVTAWAAPSSS